jgi:flavin reductase (DIM6/NTAB) family NADH-FMN oxidoreductase RutF
MSKIKIGKWNLLYPMVPVLAGANVNGKPNYITIGLVGWLCYDTISVSLGHMQYTNAGIKENMTFSINQPTASLIKKLDYCGSVSGRMADKSALFETYYGELKTAPMIKECPVNLECHVVQIITMPAKAERIETNIYIGEVNESYVDEKFLTEDGIDLLKIDPVLFSSLLPNEKTRYRGKYWRLGDYLASAWEIGKELDVKM